MDQLLRMHADQIIKASITAVLPDEAVKRALDGQTTALWSPSMTMS